MSKLKDLLQRNAYTEEGLTNEEVNEARKLIVSEKENKKRKCIVCDENSIGDTGVCKSHNYYALVVRK